MSIHPELYDFLEHIRTELPAHTHEHYEKAVNRVLEQRAHGEDEGMFPLVILAIGIIGGAALMYLFDPERGAQRRAMLTGEAHKLEHEAEEVSGRVRSEAHKVVGEVEDVAGRARHEAGKIAGEVEDAAGRARHEAGKVAGEVEDAAGRARSQASSSADAAAKQVKGAASDVKKSIDDAPKP